VSARAALLCGAVLLYPGSAAAEFPVELMKPWYAAVSKACARNDPDNAGRYAAGFKRMMALHPDAARALVSKKDFPHLDETIAHDIATMQASALQRDCHVLLELAAGREP